jgi:hypothetical protein
MNSEDPRVWKTVAASLSSTDHGNLEYVGSFKSGRVFAQLDDMPSFKRLERAGLVIIEVIEPNPKRWPGRYRTVVSLTDKGRSTLDEK